MFPIRDHNPSGRVPVVTLALILANVAIWLWSIEAGASEMELRRLYYDYALIPARFWTGDNTQALVTSMFLHGGLLHLAGNMLILWIFGDNLEDAFGHVGFAIFYLLAGLGAGFAQVLSDPASQVPMVGASGAIAGVMGGYMLLYPRAQVDVLLFFLFFVRVVAIPAWITLIGWFGLQLIGGLGSDSALGGVAYWAHVGGFVAGLVLTLPAWFRRGGPDHWRGGGQPAQPPAQYRITRTHIPKVTRKRK